MYYAFTGIFNAKNEEEWMIIALFKSLYKSVLNTHILFGRYAQNCLTWLKSYALINPMHLFS